MSSRTWATSATTARPWWHSPTWTWTRRRCGLSTTCGAWAPCRARTCCSTRCLPRSRRPSTPTTSGAARLGGRLPRRPETQAGRSADEGRRRAGAPRPLIHAPRKEPMGEQHVVRFEPVGIEIKVDEEKTVLRAAAEQGITLMHGCKEGQCAACKSFVLDGDDIELDRYSTFALPDFELEEGFTLLCRAHVYEDVTIELLNYDEEMIHSGLPIQSVHAEVVSNELVAPDMHSLVLRLVEPTELAFFPGQYVDLTVPGTETTRSFSIANTSSKESGQLEFVIRAYPD